MLLEQDTPRKKDRHQIAEESFLYRWNISGEFDEEIHQCKEKGGTKNTEDALCALADSSLVKHEMPPEGWELNFAQFL